MNGWNYNIEDFKKILKFYLSCVEEEDLKSLTMKIEQFNRSFIYFRGETFCEPFFHRNVPEVTRNYEPNQTNIIQFLTSGVAEAGERENFYYGYPIHIDGQDNIMPLFFSRIEVKRNNNQNFTLRRLDLNEFMFNHHFLISQNYPLDEIQQIQDELEGDRFGTFNARLNAACGYLGINRALFNFDQIITTLPRPGLGSRWVNIPIIFKNAGSNFTINLRKELQAFLRYPNILNESLNTSLKSILQPNSIKLDEIRNRIKIIEIVPLNEFQKTATELSHKSSFTVITGPPGTGKSQVVVDLLASHALAGKPVLFASKNHKAVDVVIEKLSGIMGNEYNFILKLGPRRDVMPDTRNRITTILNNLRNHPPISLPQGNIGAIENEIIGIKKEIAIMKIISDNIDEAQNNCNKYAIIIQNENWIECALDKEIIITNEDLISLKHKCLSLIGKEPLGFLLWLQKFILGYRLRLRLINRLYEIIKKLPDIVETDIQNRITYEARYEDLVGIINEILALKVWKINRNEYIQQIEMLNMMETVECILRSKGHLISKKTEYYQQLLKSSWVNRVIDKVDEVIAQKNNYFDNTNNFANNALAGTDFIDLLNNWRQSIIKFGQNLPIWIVTNLATRNALPLMPNLFDLVIIDEATQCDIASALPLLYRAKRAVIIGDDMQLRHISTIKPDKEIELANKNEAVTYINNWSYVNKSLLDLAYSVYEARNLKPVFLAEHYRSHPDISGFINPEFYGGQLVQVTNVKPYNDINNQLGSAVFWHHVAGHVPVQHGSAYNLEEIDEAIRLIDQWRNFDFFRRDNFSLGFITPFTRQMNEMKRRLNNQNWPAEVMNKITIGNIHKFQGDERDIIIFSPIIAEGISEHHKKWIADKKGKGNLLNVAVSRTRASLHIVGDRQHCLEAGGYIGSLAQYCIDIMNPLAINNPAEQEMSEILNELGLWYRPQYKVGNYYLDFLVIPPMGTKIDLEVDGKYHRTPEQLNNDMVRDNFIANQGYKIIRIYAGDIFNCRDLVVERIKRI